MESYLFFGEFGYLQQAILPYTQRFVKTHPEKKGKITLYTYAGNEFSFESLFPGFFHFALLALRNERNGFISSLEPLFGDIPHISKMFDEPLPKWLGELPYTGDMTPYYIEKPISCPEYSELDELRNKFKKVVVTFFRNRNHCLERNFDSSNEKWNALLEKELQNEDTLFCIYNGSVECAIPSYVDTSKKNVYLIPSLQESAYWFHKCDIAYMNDTGLADFAKNCNIRKIVILPGQNNVLFDANVYFNPFQASIEIFGDFTFQVQTK
jgi:hypothetical protein